MQIAFKEWAIVVDALARGEQILILRKGGIAEGRGGFKPEHPRFLLFPTGFHEQRESVVPAAQRRFDEIVPTLPKADQVKLEYWAELATWRQIDSLEAAERLRGQHIWRDEVIAQRFEWGKQKSVYALLVRVYRLPRPVVLPMSAAYGGCKSWIQMERDVATPASQPVLDTVTFEEKLRAFSHALDTALVG